MPRSTKARKCTETTSGDSKHPDEPSYCIICLEKVVCRGKLSVCNHWFCFPCILEWSENTNTCPICKTRFRCITKIHLDPFRSPPTKVRVGDRDQRVWNDDDDLVADDVPNSDDSNGDQEPSFSSENSQRRSTTRQVGRRGASATSRQLRLDDYDFEDSFIDDTDETLQAYLYVTYSQEALHIDVIDNGSEESCSGESSDDSVGQRTSPYKLRNRHSPVATSSRNTRSSIFDSLPNTGVDELCLSPASVGSLIVDSDDESSDDMNIAVTVSTANHSKKSKGKRKLTTRKHNNSRTRKSSETSRLNSSTRRRSQQSHKARKQQELQERCSKSKRKRQNSASEDEFQPGTSSRNGSHTNQSSIDGWISMATKRAKAHSHSLTSSTANQRTVSRKQACKGKKPVENGESSHHSEPYESSSDSENEVLIERIKKARVKARSDGRKEKKCQNASKTSVTTRGSENRHSNKFCARQELHQQGIDSPTPSTSTDIQEDDFSIVTIIQPTPQPDKKRSIFTKRQHRPPSTSFDHLEDFAVSDTEMQQDQSSGLTNHHLKTISNHKRAENALVHKSGIVIKLDKSPFIKKKKPQRRRVMSLSSDSD